MVLSSADQWSLVPEVASSLPPTPGPLELSSLLELDLPLPVKDVPDDPLVTPSVDESLDVLVCVADSVSSALSLKSSVQADGPAPPESLPESLWVL